MSSSSRARAALVVTSAFVALAASVVCAPSAHADDALAPPPLTVTIAPGNAGGPWTLRVDNTGDVPVRIAADARLLALEVTPPAGFVDDTPKTKRPGAAAKKADDAKPVRCVLPDDARPSSDDGRELVIPGKRSWSSTIDPLLYCFAPRERARLVAGATVKPLFGWAPPPPRPTARGQKPVPAGPPFVASAVGAAVGRVAPAKVLEGAPIVLADAVSTTATGAAQPLLHSLVVSLPDALDVSRGNEVGVTVTVVNEGDKSVVVLFRPETLRFSVSGPAGSVACGTTRDVSSPIRELYSTVGVKGRASTTVLLTAICPSDTFDQPGIYRVTPILDTSGASARSIGLKTWDGVVEGTTSMLLRVRTARRPESPDNRRPRPTLD